jgi:hypothetical protein
MFKRVAVSVLCAVLVAACSDPKSAVVPQDLSNLESLKPSIEKLTPPDRELFSAYVMRKALGEKLGGLFGGPLNAAAGVPAGMTIGAAIEDQRKFAADQAIEAAKAQALKAKLEREREAALKAMRDVITVALVSKRMDVDRGMSGMVLDEKLAVVFGYQNNGSKDVAAVKGMITTRDLLGDEISSFHVSNDATIPAGKSATWTGARSVRFSLGGNNDKKLADLPDGKYTVEWAPEVIVFTDGTKLVAPAKG